MLPTDNTFKARTATSELPLHRPRCDHANVYDYVSVAHISNDAEAIQPPGPSWCDYIGLELGNFAKYGTDERAASPISPAEVGTNRRNVFDNLQQADKGLLADVDGSVRDPERKASLLRQVEDRMAEFQCRSLQLVHAMASSCRMCRRSTGTVRRCMASLRPEHWHKDPDLLAASRESAQSAGQLQRWVAAVLGKKLQRSSDEQASRAFWLARERRCQMHGGTNDSPMELIRGVLSRKQPLKATSLYLLYCSSVTASFMHCRHYAASGQPWFVEEVAHMAQYIMESHDVMQTCTGFLATALFMTLSFRMNRAATRWWHGREMCANLLSSARSLGQEAQLCCNDKASAMELSLLVAWL
ncbi:hypothetical protein AK812_SmicGene35736 [Symbiodinium microadriaticum]|uniref:Uncharacterized protein n=1 Tax=Symbiodinium microadriaticum TaxID=2951 RepID=A0A1Q9CKP3_SYMMI|nr:hypothetical protein AK812_SmicGene35736 [Symbiodinium microadriaticum]